MRLSSILTVLLLARSALAGEFKLFETTEKTEESVLHTLTVVTDKEWFVMVPPLDLIRRADADQKKIVFESNGGGAAMVMTFTTNSPSVLPDEGLLRTNITKLYPGAQILQSVSIRTRPMPGQLFELKTGDGNLALMTQHAFIPTEEGLVELKFTVNSDDYKKQVRNMRDILLTFHSTPKPASK